jgi:hypothetical protein
MCWQKFHDNAARKYHQMQRERIHLFLRSVLHEPERVFQHHTLYVLLINHLLRHPDPLRLPRMSISMAMLMMYGYAPESLDDPIIHIADEGATLGASLLEPGGTLINVLPILRHIPSWVPGATAKKMAEKARWLAEEMKRIPMERVTAAMVGCQLPNKSTGQLMP